MQSTPHIYEDPGDCLKASPPKTNHHSRVPSMGEVLRGRKIRNAVSNTTRGQSPTTQSPLGERHINSPPPLKRAMAPNSESRPSMHKKTTSSVSVQSLVRGKEDDTKLDNLSSPEVREESHKPQKTKSSTNLAGLLRKRSKKGEKDGKGQEVTNKENQKPAELVSEPRTPIWAQLTTQPLQRAEGVMQCPPMNGIHPKEQPQVGTRSDSVEIHSSQLRNHHEELIPAPVCSPPRRPFLEHKSSRSSIFTENIDDDVVAVAPRDFGDKTTVVRPKLELHLSNSSEKSDNIKRSSRVMDVINTLNFRTRKDQSQSVQSPGEVPQSLSPQQLDTELEKVLDSMNIPQNLRDGLRNLKADVKVGLIKGDRIGSGSSTASVVGERPDERSSMRSPTKRGEERPKSQDGGRDGKRSRSRSRVRSRILSIGRREGRSGKSDAADEPTSSPTKSRPKSIDLSNSRPLSSRSMASSMSTTSLATPDSAVSPGDFLHYLREVQKPELIEVGKIHKLRILLRNESVTWTNSFVRKGGMDELVQLLYRIAKVEWREEHEDTLLHESLLCLKALCTTSLALEKLAQIEAELFPTLLAMLFDEEKKGPSEFSTRSIIISLLFAHLSAKLQAPAQDLEARARTILVYLRDPAPKEDKQPLGFISQMHISRPYRVWCKEVVNVTKEVFWIFLHNVNVIPIIPTDLEAQAVSFAHAHFPSPRPPHPAAPYVGGVEWEATQYLSTHLDLLNGVLASLPTTEERNNLRQELRQSGWEKVMGGTMRTCKEKFYGGVHEGLKVWVAAAKADGWPVEDVRAGPPRETVSPRKSPVKKKTEDAPKISFDVGIDTPLPKMDDAWL